jgi:sec-independent protein translocase protein TatA
MTACPPAGAVAAAGAFCHYPANAREREQGENCIMGTFSIWHWLIVLAVVLILFGGGGKLSRLMGDFGKGLKSFKKGMGADDSIDADATDSEPEPKALNSESAAAEGAAEKEQASKG